MLVLVRLSRVPCENLIFSYRGRRAMGTLESISVKEAIARTATVAGDSPAPIE